MKRKRHNVEQGPPFGLTDDYSAHPVNTAERVKAGPNRYAMMKDRMQFYGRNFDYRIMDREDEYECEDGHRCKAHKIPEYGLDIYCPTCLVAGKHSPLDCVEGNSGVWMPACEVAQEWLRSKVGETQHFFTDLDGWCGIAVSDLDALKAAAERDGLIDEADYVENMNEDQERARQWE